MTSTLLHWVNDVREHLDGANKEPNNQLASAYTAGSGTMSFAHPLAGISAGAVLSVGMNTLSVISTNPLAMTATVIGGYASSTDANAAAAATVRVNPRFTDARIVRELGTALSSMASPTGGLYAVTTLTHAVASGVAGYEITPATGFRRILEVRRLITDDATSYARVDAADWDCIRSADLTAFPSGVALRFKRHPGDVTVQVVYAKAFTAITDLAADVSTTGIPSTAEDLPPLGAAINCMAGREVPRNSPLSQGDSRKAAEVPPGAIAASARGLQIQYLRRLKEESDNLRSGFPVGA